MTDKGETLTDALLATLPAKLQRPIREGRYVRYGCPFHGSDHQHSLSIDTETGRFKCFSCNVWGYTEQSREEYKRKNPLPSPSLPAAARRPKTPTDTLRQDGDQPTPLDADALAQLKDWQQDLSEAADYLALRRIPLELAHRLGAGVGTFGNARRLVLPHTNPKGQIVSLYGRRIDGGAAHKHHHLGGRPKGFLNALATQFPEVWLTEGPFDALALMAAGIPCAAAVFGVDGIRWSWLTTVRRLVLAFDIDAAGHRATEAHGKQALMRDIKILRVTADELGGSNDISEAWAAGTLRLTPLDPLPARFEPVKNSWSALPEAPPHGLPVGQWMSYRALCQRFSAEQLAVALAVGWTRQQLFALPPNPRQPWGGGVLWMFADREITYIGPDLIRAVASNGAVHSLQRCYLTPEQLGPVPLE